MNASADRRTIPMLLPPMLALALALVAVPPPASGQETKAIQDNSFLIEEAYNQERGVIQHINTFQRLRSGDWAYTFTQEWPVPDQRHQLSVTLPVLHVEDNTGVGDIALNYRHQLIGNGESRVAVAPRFSILLPTGDEKEDLGKGGVGLQFNLPVSLVLHRDWVTHLNAGTTFTPSARNAGGAKGSTRDVNLGASVVWLASQNFNVLLEAAWTTVESVESRAVKTRSSSFFINPGIRWAHNFENGLQIVPGLAIPVGIGRSAGEYGVLFYLSFEHPLFK